MIGEMLLGVLIFVGIGVIGFAIVWLFDNDITSTFVAIGMVLAWICVGIVLPGNIKCGFYSIFGAAFVAGILGSLIWKVCDRFNFNPRIASVCSIIILIASFVGFGYRHLCNTNYSRNIVSIEEPVITETKYEILGGSDTTRISGYVYGGIHYTRGSTVENSYFKVYIPYKNSDGETVVMPYTMRESDVTVILMPDLEEGSEYLIQTVATYYKEDRNKEPTELIEERKVVTNKLYVSEATFGGMKIDGD